MRCSHKIKFMRAISTFHVANRWRLAVPKKLNPEGRKSNRERAPAIAEARTRLRRDFPKIAELADRLSAGSLTVSEAKLLFHTAVDEAPAHIGAEFTSRFDSLPERRLEGIDTFTRLCKERASLAHLHSLLNEELTRVEEEIGIARELLFQSVLETERVPAYVKQFFEKCQDAGMTGAQFRDLTKEDIRTLIDLVQRRIRGEK